MEFYFKGYLKYKTKYLKLIELLKGGKPFPQLEQNPSLEDCFNFLREYTNEVNELAGTNDKKNHKWLEINATRKKERHIDKQLDFCIDKIKEAVATVATVEAFDVSIDKAAETTNRHSRQWQDTRNAKLTTSMNDAIAIKDEFRRIEKENKELVTKNLDNRKKIAEKFGKQNLFDPEVNEALKKNKETELQEKEAIRIGKLYFSREDEQFYKTFNLQKKTEEVETLLKAIAKTETKIASYELALTTGVNPPHKGPAQDELKHKLPQQKKQLELVEEQIGRFNELPKKLEEIVKLLAPCIADITTKNIYSVIKDNVIQSGENVGDLNNDQQCSPFVQKLIKYMYCKDLPNLSRISEEASSFLRSITKIYYKYTAPKDDFPLASRPVEVDWRGMKVREFSFEQDTSVWCKEKEAKEKAKVKASAKGALLDTSDSISLEFQTKDSIQARRLEYIRLWGDIELECLLATYAGKPIGEELRTPTQRERFMQQQLSFNIAKEFFDFIKDRNFLVKGIDNNRDLRSMTKRVEDSFYFPPTWAKEEDDKAVQIEQLKHFFTMKLQREYTDKPKSFLLNELRKLMKFEKDKREQIIVKVPKLIFPYQIGFPLTTSQLKKRTADKWVNTGSTLARLLFDFDFISKLLKAFLTKWGCYTEGMTIKIFKVPLTPTEIKSIQQNNKMNNRSLNYSLYQSADDNFFTDNQTKLNLTIDIDNSRIDIQRDVDHDSCKSRLSRGEIHVYVEPSQDVLDQQDLQDLQDQQDTLDVHDL